MRVLDLADGYSSSTAPTSTVTATITGSMGSPTLVVAANGITPAGVGEQVIFVAGTGGVDISANPQIAAGTQVGQKLTIIGTSDTDTVTLDDGTGLSQNGSITLKQHYEIRYMWTGSVWKEEFRREA